MGLLIPTFHVRMKMRVSISRAKTQRVRLKLQRSLVCARLHVPASPGYHQYRMLLHPMEFCTPLLLLNQAINNAKSSRITGSGWKHWWDTNKHTRTTRSTSTHILFPRCCQLHHLSAAPSNQVREHKIEKTTFSKKKKNIHIYTHYRLLCCKLVCKGLQVDPSDSHFLIVLGSTQCQLDVSPADVVRTRQQIIHPMTRGSLFV